jgi:AcrR family transcriptional regulator
MHEQTVRLTREGLAAAAGSSWSASDIDAAVALLDGNDGRLPAGTRSLPADLVDAIQRERILAAMLVAATDLGYRALNVQDVIDRAGISRPTFYVYFANKEDCFLAAFDSVSTRLLELVEAAVEGGGESWREKLRAGLEAVLRFASTEPESARTMIVEARGGSPRAQQRHEALLDRFAAGLQRLVRDEPSSPVAAAALIGGIEAMLYSRLYEGRIEEIESLLPAMMYFAVLPFAGIEAAREELGGAAGS